MADLLTHILVPFVILTPVRWLVSFPRRWVPVAMGGAAIPDLVKLNILIDERVIQQALDIPFAYSPISSLGGVLVIAVGIAVLFNREVMKQAYGLLVFGGFTALILDGLRVYVDGSAGFWLYPIWIRPPTPSLYVTSQFHPLAIVVPCASVIAVVDLIQRRRVSGS